jgi:hypothetical protein
MKAEFLPAMLHRPRKNIAGKKAVEQGNLTVNIQSIMGNNV